MKQKDYLIVALAPVPLLLVALFGNTFVEGWNWNPGAFVLLWVVVAAATFVYRWLATSQAANLPFKLGVGLAVLASFVLGWITLAVKVIGEENPANLFYFLIILGGLVGVGLARFQAAKLAKVAFAMAGAVLLVPVLALLLWPESDFSPGVDKVFVLNGFFVAMYVVSGLLLRHAGGRTAKADPVRAG
jgi:hypothetical protein